VPDDGGANAGARIDNGFGTGIVGHGRETTLLPKISFADSALEPGRTHNLLVRVRHPHRLRDHLGKWIFGDLRDLGEGWFCHQPVVGLDGLVVDPVMLRVSPPPAEPIGKK